MKMNFARVVGKAVAFAEGSVLMLHPEQAARRSTWLAAEKGGKTFRLLARLTFKAGEVVGIAGDAEVEKQAALHVETVSKADFDAYGARLAQNRAASHTAAASPDPAAVAAAIKPGPTSATTTDPTAAPPGPEAAAGAPAAPSGTHTPANP